MRGLRGLRHRLVSGGGIAIVALLTFLALLLQDRALEGWRVDLTADRIWTLSDGTRALLTDLETAVTLRFYFSRSVASDAPVWSDYARFVGDTLVSFTRASEGRLRLERVDPQPLSEAADAARAAGLDPVPLGPAGEELFLGVVAQTADGRRSVLARLEPEDDALLEYRLARLLEELLRPGAPRVALVSGVPLAEGVDGAGRRRRGSEIHRRLAQRFDLLTGTAEEVSAGLEGADVLVLVHPRGLADEVTWAVDQFALGGGRVLLLVDPLAERDPGADALAFANPFASRASTAPALLRSWGIEFSREVLLDADHAMPVTLAPDRPAVRHLAMLALGPEAFATDDPVLARLEQLNVSTAGALRPLPGAGTDFRPLITSGRASALADPGTLLRARDPSELSLAFAPDDSRHVLAARVRGPARSAFADLPGFDAGRSEGDIEVLVVADTDLLSDALWLAPDRSGTGTEVWAGNGDFLVNAVDQLAGSDALIGIRGTPRFARPLSRLDSLRRDAEARLRARLTRLEGALAGAGAGPRDALAAATDAEQKAEQARLREEIRSVQRALTADVERVTVQAELFGVLAAPVLVICFGALVAWRRRRAGA